MDLSELETTVLHRFRSDFAAIPGLVDQLNAVEALSRENTGSGFFTELAVDRSKAAAVSCSSPIGNYHVTLEGMRYPIGLLLFFKEGYARLLEGYAVAGEDTSASDLTTVAHGDVLSPEQPGWNV